MVPAQCTLGLDKFIPNRDLGIIEDNVKQTILNEVRRKNPNFDVNYLEIKSKNNTGATLVATEPSRYKTDSTVYIKFLIQENLYDTKKLLDTWSLHYNTTLAEIEREFKEDYIHFTEEHKRTFKDDMKFKLRTLLNLLHQNIAIIMIDGYIRKLYDRVVALENDLSELKAIIERSQRETECAKVSVYFDRAKAGTDGFGSVVKSFEFTSKFLPKSAEYVPVVGYAFQALSVLNSIQCFIQFM